MSDTICVTGASGFVGTAVVEELLSRGYRINALVNREVVQIGGDRVRSIKGGLFDSAAIAQAIAGCRAVVHLVGIIVEQPGKGVTFDRIHYEGTKNMVEGAKAAGVRRYVQMSALGTRPDAVSDYHKSKYRAEEYVRDSGLDWTIIRPSMIHGPRPVHENGSGVSENNPRRFCSCLISARVCWGPAGRASCNRFT